MIRRDAINTLDRTPRWILIAQQDHARLAGQLAEHWGPNGFVPPAPREALLWAIYHHDDGWHDWDLSPRIDPQNGRPRSFFEMERSDSLAIWTRSIDNAARAGYLQAYTVAGHFSRLARRSAAWRTDDPQQADVERFLDRTSESMAEWLLAWQAEDAERHKPDIARLAVAQLQFFDSLSLWFCCMTTLEAESLEAPGAKRMELAPVDAARVEIDPWPLDVTSLALGVSGRSIPVGCYSSGAELAAAGCTAVQLDWHLQPRGGGDGAGEH